MSFSDAMDNAGRDLGRLGREVFGSDERPSDVRDRERDRDRARRDRDRTRDGDRTRQTRERDRDRTRDRDRAEAGRDRDRRDEPDRDMSLSDAMDNASRDFDRAAREAGDAISSLFD